MSFLTPLYLLGALAIAIPVIIHLINIRRPNKQVFSTLYFFKQLQKSSIKRLKLKRRILLAIRIAAILLLAIALARPMISPGSSFNFTSGSVLYLVLFDNGPTMGVLTQDGPKIDRGREVVEELAARASSDDRFLIYNTHGELLFSEELSPDQAIRQIRQIEPVNAGNFTGRRITELLRRSESTERDQKSFYVITRGDKQTAVQLDQADLESVGSLELIPLTLVKISDDVSENVGITSIRPVSRILSSGRPVSLEVEVQHFGEVPVFNHFLSLEAGDEMIAQYAFDLEPGQSRVFSFEVEPQGVGTLAGRAILEGNPVGFDNERFFALDIPEARRILLITPEAVAGTRNSWLKPVFEAAGRAAGEVIIQQINWNEFTSAMATAPDAVIIEGGRDIPEFSWATLTGFMQQGGGLLFFPGDDGRPEAINRFLNEVNAGRFTGISGAPGRFEQVARVSRIVRGHPVLDDIFVISDDEDVRIDLPQLYHYWRYAPGGRGSQQILGTNLGDPLITQHNIGEGKLFVSAINTGPAWSSFMSNPLFAPFFYRLGMYAASGEAGGLAEFELGKNFDWITTRDLTQPLLNLNELSVAPETQSVSRGVRIQAQTDEWRPGILEIESRTGGFKIAVNQLATESDPAALSLQELTDKWNPIMNVTRAVDISRDRDQNLAVQLGAAGAGAELWNWFVFLGIILLLSESMATKKLEGDET
ncbi:MAG: BatA domain-containing protein [Balneolales bacterium]|nr:BatA domain-containing protein [Balneolales bacterium]